jgi:UDP-GlcNAc3NAcA epimerase
MRKLVTIVGARPQFVKCAAVSTKLRRAFREVLVHTGQHYDANMSGVFFDELGIPAPEHNLAVGSGHHGGQTADMLKGIEALLLKERPDAVVVYGDTNSTLAGALAAVKLHIPVLHIEAGLRSFNRRMPEEINRVLTDHVSSLLFCPSTTAQENLLAEGIRSGVIVVGDVMQDAMLLGLSLAKSKSGILDRHGLKSGEYFLATVHRAENTDDPARLQGILGGFAKLASTGYPIVLPVHPRTRQKLKDVALDLHNSVQLIEPLSFVDMLAVEQNARAVLTDSGGVQKEAVWLGVPCVTLRDETEWVETVSSGWNVLVGCDSDSIVSAAMRQRPDHNPNALVGGAADQIVDEIAKFFH